MALRPGSSHPDPVTAFDSNVVTGAGLTDDDVVEFALDAVHRARGAATVNGATE